LKLNLRQKTLGKLGILTVLAVSGDQSKQNTDTQLAAPEAEPAPLAVERIPELAASDMTMAAAPKTHDADAAAEKLIRASFLKGDYATADSLVREQLADETLSEGYKGWLNGQIPIIRLGWAWALIREKKCDEALPLLESTPDNTAQSLALKGLGYCLYAKKDFANAGSYLENYLEKNKSDPEAYILLAEVKESLGDMTEAWELAQRATSLQNLTEEETRELERREASLNAKAEESAGQGELASGFIRLRYQFGQHQHLLSGSLQVLQRTIETLNLQLGLPYPAEPIEVIFHQSENFGRIAHSPSWTAGLYDGRVRIPIPQDQAFDEDFARILRHEIAHAVLSEHAQHRSLPAWFQEGLAQVAECPELCWRYSFAATTFPFLQAQAFDGGFLQLNRGEAQVAYKQSFYMMQVLYFQVAGLQGIKQIIEQIPVIQDLSSDGLLYQIGQTFAVVHQKAAESWVAQRSF
jgi:tetratricopeptide (TPR) repeat protein